MYEKFMDGPPEIVQPFQIFLNGTSYRKTTNQSLLKYLPKDIVRKIWYEYVYNMLPLSDLVRLDLLQILQEKYRKNTSDFFNFFVLLRLAVQYEHMEMYMWLFEEAAQKDELYRYGQYYGGDLLVAVENGNLEFVKFLLPKVSLDRYLTSAQQNAARRGHLHILQYLYEIDPSNFMSQTCITLAATNGHLHVIEWIFPRSRDQSSFFAFFGAAENEHYEVLDWLFKNMPVKTPKYTAKNLLNSQIFPFSDTMVRYLQGWCFRCKM